MLQDFVQTAIIYRKYSAFCTPLFELSLIAEKSHPILAFLTPIPTVSASGYALILRKMCGVSSFFRNFVPKLCSNIRMHFLF